MVTITKMGSSAQAIIRNGRNIVHWMKALFDQSGGATRLALRYGAGKGERRVKLPVTVTVKAQRTN